MTKKILSLILVLTMIFSLSAVSSFAEDLLYDDGTTTGDTIVTGTITPTVVSFTIPTSTSFTLDPNQEIGERFVSTGFSVTNNATAPLTVSVDSFAQKAEQDHFFTDVEPDKYGEWGNLGKTISESEIALGLKIDDSSQWSSVTREATLYVVDSIEADAADADAAIEIGVINPNQTVDFNFEASHGNSFSEEITSEYVISWIFGLA